MEGVFLILLAIIAFLALSIFLGSFFTVQTAQGRRCARIGRRPTSKR